MNKTITNTILMVRPAHFGFNIETASNNSFQTKDDLLSANEMQKLAVAEFDAMVEKLRSHGINVQVIEDTTTPEKPDAIFPNNWFSTHIEGAFITYPMYAPNRRIEKRPELIQEIIERYKYSRRYTFDYHEEDDIYLEGTGSMILDRANKILYACLSDRTEIRILEKFCVLMGYEKVVFYALDRAGEKIYHTNVMMALGEELAIVCLDCIKEDLDRKQLSEKLKATGKQIVEISLEQVEQFAGNMLEVSNHKGNRFMVMSDAAFDALTGEQKEQISNHSEIIHCPIPTIEKYGGGSVRCMMAELFVPINDQN